MDPEQEEASCMSGENDLMAEIPDYKRSMQADVEIFVAGSPHPIRTSALILASSSPLLACLLHQISFCAGCPAARTLILEDDKEAVRALVTWVEQVAFQEVDPREDFALLPPSVQEQVVSLSHRLQLLHPPAETEVKVEVVEELSTNTLDWQLQISEIHSVGEEVNKRDEMKKKLRNSSIDPISLKLVEPINGKIQKNPQQITSVKKNSVLPLVIKREKCGKNEPVLSVKVKKEKGSSEDPILFTEDGGSDLLSRSLNAAYRKMTGSKQSSGGGLSSDDGRASPETKRRKETSENSDQRKKRAGRPHSGEDSVSKKRNKVTKTEPGESSSDKESSNNFEKSPRSIRGGRKQEGNILEVTEAEHELVVVKRENLEAGGSQRLPKERQASKKAEVAKRLLSPRRAKERSVAGKDSLIKTEPGKDEGKDSLKIKLKFSKQNNKKEKAVTQNTFQIKSEIKEEPNDHIMFNEKTMDLSFFTEANLRSATEEEIVRDVEGDLKVWVSRYHGPSLVPVSSKKIKSSSAKPLPGAKQKEETFQIKIKKEPEGKTIVESYAKSRSKPDKKSNSCGHCKGCQNTKDCGKCLNCLDNARLAGKSGRRLRCSRRMCKAGASAKTRKILESLPPVQTCAECNIEVVGGREPYEKHMLLWHDKYFSDKYDRFVSVKEDRKVKVKIRRSNETVMLKPKKEQLPKEVCRKKKQTKKLNGKESKQRRSLVAIQHMCHTDQMVDIGLRKISL